MVKKIEEKCIILYKTIIIHKYLCIIIVLVCAFIIYAFFPHNLYKLLLDEETSLIVTVVIITNDGDVKKIILSDEQNNEIREILNNSYVRTKVFNANYITENYMGYQIIINNNATFYFFSVDIISINGKQYKVYGHALADEFKSIIKKEN